MTSARQHTRAIVTLHSHVNEIGESPAAGRFVDLSSDCVSLKTTKNTKAAGTWELSLVPRRNYLNFIFPNDVVNIYLDPGDGDRGFVRTMLGYVDRVERSESTDATTGGTKTTYSVIGTDFQKAFDKTSIYFNNQLRQILDERFARTSDGHVRPTQGNDEGLALRQAGLTTFGTPADFVENMLITLLGFGQQWRLPGVYARNRNSLQENRQRRIQRAMDKAPENLVHAVFTLGFNLEARRETIEAINNKVAEIDKSLAEKTITETDKQVQAARALRANGYLRSLRTILESADQSFPTGLLDLLSFDFIEYLAIDGYNQNDSVWQSDGALSQFVYGHSNDVVNELIFDLRPVSENSGSGDGGLRSGGYSYAEDDLGINVHGIQPKFPPNTRGVQYVPAVVFREYPYSVVDSFRLNDVTVIPAESADQDPLGEPLTVFFGPVFGKNPNLQSGPGRRNGQARVTYEYDQAISPNSCKAFPHQKPIKHLDVVVINNTDVVNAQIGRSDEDMFNLFQLTPTTTDDMHEDIQSILTNFSPVINQISIARHGLRTWAGNTIFANHSQDSGCGEIGGSVDNSSVRRNLARWQILLDHWYQHNPEYLNGSIVLRGMPEIRVGYRLDWKDRNESYYVEAVTHQWAYPGAMQTTVQVTRGQRNDPFPAYIPPVFLDDSDKVVRASSGDRSENGRLAQFFKVRDTQATERSTQRRQPMSLAENITDQAENISRNGKVIFPTTGERGKTADFGTLDIPPDFDGETDIG
jgi:hypothetical protein